MTRFFVGQSYEKTVEMLRSTFDKLNYASSIDTKGVVRNTFLGCVFFQSAFSCLVYCVNGRQSPNATGLQSNFDFYGWQVVGGLQAVEGLRFRVQAALREDQGQSRVHHRKKLGKI